LILGNITKFDATRSQILKLKCTKFDFRWDSAPYPAGGAYSAPQTLWLYLMEPTSSGREGEKGGLVKERGGENKGREAWGQAPKIF